MSFPCPVCDHPKTAVKDSRSTESVYYMKSHGPNIRRRRQCSKCGTRFTTHETVEVQRPRDFDIRMSISPDGTPHFSVTARLDDDQPLKTEP